MRSFFKKLLGRDSSYERLIDVRISRSAILHNLHAFQERYGIGVAPVLKSNAYGHGLVEVAGILKNERIPFLCVDSFFEALMLRNKRLDTPLVVIGYTPLQNVIKNKLRYVAFAIISLEELKRLAKEKASVTIHLKIDTGMHRHGIMPSEIDEAIAIVTQNPQIVTEGVYTHLADPDTEDSEHTKKQIATWNVIAAKVKKNVPGIKYFHCGQTAGSFYSNDIDANVMRLGIGLYGINSGLDSSLVLQPALQMQTRITSLRTLQVGESIGYNATFTAQATMKIASIPAGYTEGIDRRLSNKGVVTVHSIPCPIVGRVSMNITSIDVSKVPNINLDDEVLVISNDASAPNSIQAMAKLCETIPYELLVHVPAVLHRSIL